MFARMEHEFFYMIRISVSFRFSSATDTDRRVESTLSWKGNVHAFLLDIFCMLFVSLCVCEVSMIKELLV